MNGNGRWSSSLGRLFGDKGDMILVHRFEVMEVFCFPAGVDCYAKRASLE